MSPHCDFVSCCPRATANPRVEHPLHHIVIDPCQLAISSITDTHDHQTYHGGDMISKLLLRIRSVLEFAIRVLKKSYQYQEFSRSRNV